MTRAWETTGTDPCDAVLDIGCGFAEHNLFRPRIVRLNTLIGANISSEQFAMDVHLHPHRKRTRACLLGVDVVRLPFAGASSDAVLGVESAFHFRILKAFFEEALRLLKPGVRLALVDLFGVDCLLAPKDRLAEFVSRSFWQIPKKSLVPGAEYARQPQRAGFADIPVKSIRRRVYPCLADYGHRRLHVPDAAARLSLVFRRMRLAGPSARHKLPPGAMNYVLAGAHRPITVGTLSC